MKKILVVDDNVVNLKVVDKILKVNEDYKPVLIPSGKKALQFLETKKNSCGQDGMYLSELSEYWHVNQTVLMEQLLTGTYEPGIVKIVEIYFINNAVTFLEIIHI